MLVNRLGSLQSSALTTLLAALLTTGALLAADGPLQPKEEDTHGKPIRFAAYSPDGKRLVTSAGDGTLRVWNPKECSLLKNIKGPLRRFSNYFHVSFEAIGFSADGKRFASVVFAFDRTELHIWNTETLEQETLLRGEYQLRADGAEWMVFLPDSGKPAYAKSNALHVWDVETNEREERPLGYIAPHMRVRFDEENRPLAICGDARALICPFGAKEEAVYADALGSMWGDLSPDGKLFVSLRFGFDTRRTSLILRSAEDLSEQATITPKGGDPAYCCWDMKSHLLVVMTYKGIVERWEVSGPTYRGRLKESLAFGRTSDERISYGDGGRREPLPLGHPTPLLVSPDGSQVCFLGGRQFALLEAKWQE